MPVLIFGQFIGDGKLQHIDSIKKAQLYSRRYYQAVLNVNRFDGTPNISPALLIPQISQCLAATVNVTVHYIGDFICAGQLTKLSLKFCQPKFIFGPTFCAVYTNKDSGVLKKTILTHA